MKNFINTISVLGFFLLYSMNNSLAGPFGGVGGGVGVGGARGFGSSGATNPAGSYGSSGPAGFSGSSGPRSPFNPPGSYDPRSAIDPPGAYDPRTAVNPRGSAYNPGEPVDVEPLSSTGQRRPADLSDPFYLRNLYETWRNQR